jgi:hypothetical protein
MDPKLLKSLRESILQRIYTDTFWIYIYIIFVLNSSIIKSYYIFKIKMQSIIGVKDKNN